MVHTHIIERGTATTMVTKQSIIRTNARCVKVTSLIWTVHLQKSRNAICMWRIGTVGWVNFVRKKFRHIRNRYTNEKIERINLHTCALKTKFFPLLKQRWTISRERLAFVAITNTKLFGLLL